VTHNVHDTIYADWLAFINWAPLHLPFVHKYKSISCYSLAIFRQNRWTAVALICPVHCCALIMEILAMLVIQCLTIFCKNILVTIQKKGFSKTYCSLIY